MASLALVAQASYSAVFMIFFDDDALASLPKPP
jgi:hypothetical protein